MHLRFLVVVTMVFVVFTLAEVADRVAELRGTQSCSSISSK